jgi:hypothetical protein
MLEEVDASNYPIDASINKLVGVLKFRRPMSWETRIGLTGANTEHLGQGVCKTSKSAKL